MWELTCFAESSSNRGGSRVRSILLCVSTPDPTDLNHKAVLTFISRPIRGQINM